jgi:predicted nuclease with TOPRIM domain
MNVQIESDLKEILIRFEQKLDKLSENTNDINLRLTKVETKLDAATEDIKEIKSTQKTLSSNVSDLKGVKSLIIPIAVAVTTSILTLVIRTIPIS